MPLFPGTLSDEEMALRVKEWTLAGYVIECALREKGKPRRMEFEAEKQETYIFLHVYYPEIPVFRGSMGRTVASYRHDEETWHYFRSRWRDLED